jgi:hypothetical protein
LKSALDDIPRPGLGDARGAAVEWQNLTVYRITPIADEGVTNMNTADVSEPGRRPRA